MATKPAHQIRLGRIKATIWRNDSDQRPRWNVQVVRLYLVEKEWKQSTSFGRDDLPLVAKVSDMAHTWIHATQQGE
jgi:hypothetical protein